MKARTHAKRVRVRDMICSWWLHCTRPLQMSDVKDAICSCASRGSACHSSHVTRHTSPVTRHTSHVT